MKHCYIKMSDPLPLFHYGRFVEVMLVEDGEDEPMCWLSGSDDWELSYTGPDAELKFNALLAVSGAIDYAYLLQLGFTQYG